MADDEKTEETEESGNGNGHDDEEDLVVEALEELAIQAKRALDHEPLESDAFERSMVLSQFVVAATVNFAVEELAAAIEGARQTFRQLAPMAQMAGMAAAAGASTPPILEPAANPPNFEDLPDALGNMERRGPSWVEGVLRKEDGIPTGKKTIAIEIDCGDYQAAGPEHIALLHRMNSEGWSLEELNAELGRCERPARARISEDPAKHQ